MASDGDRRPGGREERSSLLQTSSDSFPFAEGMGGGEDYWYTLAYTCASVRVCVSVELRMDSWSLYLSASPRLNCSRPISKSCIPSGNLNTTFYF